MDRILDLGESVKNEAKPEMPVFDDLEPIAELEEDLGVRGERAVPLVVRDRDSCGVGSVFVLCRIPEYQLRCNKEICSVLFCQYLHELA